MLILLKSFNYIYEKKCSEDRFFFPDFIFLYHQIYFNFIYIYRKWPSPQTHKKHLWECMWFLRPNSYLQALLHMWQTKELSLMLIFILYTHIWLSRPAIDQQTLMQNWQELPVGCWGRTCVKSACNCLLPWDIIWLVSLALDKNILLQMLWLKTVWGKRWSLFTEVIISRWSFQSLYFKCFTIIIDHFFQSWPIFHHLLSVFNIYTKNPNVVFDILLKMCLSNQISFLVRYPTQHITFMLNISLI